MKELLDFIGANLFLVLTVLGIIILAGGFFILRWLKGRRLWKSLELVKENPDRGEEILCDQYSEKFLLNHINIIEDFAAARWAGIGAYSCINRIWIKRLEKSKSSKALNQVLKFVPETGLFHAFLAVLEAPELLPDFTAHLESSEDSMGMRDVAFAEKGMDFKGYKALEVFKDRMSEIREMAGDPEWPPRYFAIKIMLYDKDEKSGRALWEAFEDSHSLIRAALAREFKSDEASRLYERLFYLFTNDPVYEVRLAARDRIYRDFRDFHKVESGALSDYEVYHILELLPENSRNDEDFAFSYLNSENAELRLMAAGYLDRVGALTRLCLSCDFGDREILERNLNLLRKAAEVDCVSFLESVTPSDNPAALYIASVIIGERKLKNIVTLLGSRVFSLTFKGEEFKELYRETVKALNSCGNQDSFVLLNQELQKWRNDEMMMRLLIGNIPVESDFVFIETLLSFLKDKDFVLKDLLVDKLALFSEYLVIPPLVNLFRNDRDTYDHSVRITAFKLMGRFKKDYCLQFLFEHLAILPLEEARAFCQVVSENFSSKVVKEKAEKLLSFSDSRIRAALISALPPSNSLTAIIKESLKDPDPDVRIAGVWALSGLSDGKALLTALPMLRDPLERVRKEAACAVASSGGKASLDKLKELLFDENEVFPVKEAAIAGLGNSGSDYSIDILLDWGYKDESARDAVAGALSQKQEKRQILRLIEEFKNTDTVLREVISGAFKKMGPLGESYLIGMLKEGIESLREYITAILESTGGIEALIRKLSHRDATKRREAAEQLAAIGTPQAFRGIVLAARDPDQEVRISVVKALEKLETKEGKVILDSLENDPDDKIRKYTHWAIQRLKAKAL